jgi:hypothetical protein
MATSTRATKKPAKTLGGGAPLSFTLNLIRDGGSINIDGVTTATLASVVEKQLVDHRTVEELIALVAERLTSQSHWSTLGVAPPDLDLTIECLTMMLDYAPHGFGRRDLEWLTDTADDQQVRYNVLGFMRFLNIQTGELNLDVGTGFTPHYVR